MGKRTLKTRKLKFSYSPNTVQEEPILNDSGSDIWLHNCAKDGEAVSAQNANTLNSIYDSFISPYGVYFEGWDNKWSAGISLGIYPDDFSYLNQGTRRFYNYSDGAAMYYIVLTFKLSDNIITSVPIWFPYAAFIHLDNSPQFLMLPNGYGVTYKISCSDYSTNQPYRIYLKASTNVIASARLSYNGSVLITPIRTR